MKKNFATLVCLVLLLLFGFAGHVFGSTPPEINAKYRAINPTIDGYMGTAEWNDTAKYDIGLAGTTNIDAWLYAKHNGTHIHVGLLVWEINVHSTDQFTIAFDEGDDGGSGSGTRDYNLTSAQEDLKVVDGGHSVNDGFFYTGSFWAVADEIDFDADCVHENDHGTLESEIENFEGLSWVDDHWEVEFSIPFVGNDAGTSDLSDLSCTVTDTIGLKIQYYYGPGINYYFYPEGNKTEITKYANLNFPAPTVESCNVTGAKRDIFVLNEDVYSNGTGFLPTTTYDLYVVNDVDVWIDGMSIPSRIADTATSILSDANGTLIPVIVWSNPSTIGEYDVVVDVNANGLYDAGIDALDNDDVEITAGLVVPELTPILFLSTIILLMILCAVLQRRNDQEYNTSNKA